MIVGEEYRSPGNCLNAVTTLYDHGIYANLDTWQFDKEVKHQTVDEAVAIWKTSLGNYTRINEDVEDKLRQYYRSRMNPVKNRLRI